MTTIINIQKLSNQLHELWATIRRSACVFGFNYSEIDPKQIKTGKPLMI
jgi:hypothetical protein